jgi:hypothetical protein
VRVFNHHQHWAAVRETKKLLDKHNQCMGTLLVRRVIMCRVALARVYPEQCCDKRYRLADVPRSAAQQHLQFVDFHCFGISRFDTSGVAELLDHRPECSASMVR